MKVLTGKPGVEPAEDLSNDEVDAQLILEYLEAKMRGGGTDYGPPESAWLNGKKAHENRDAWKLLEGKLPNHMTELGAMKIIKRFNPLHKSKGSKEGGQFANKPGVSSGGSWPGVSSAASWKQKAPRGEDVFLALDTEMTMHRLASRFSVPPESFKVEDPTPFTAGFLAWVERDTGKMSLNSQFWGNNKKERLEESLRRSHKVVEFDGGYHGQTLLSTSPSDVLTHEYGHVLTNALAKDYPLKFRSLIMDYQAISGRLEKTPEARREKMLKFVEEYGGYAATSPHEGIAEGFMSSEKGSQTTLAKVVRQAFSSYRTTKGP